MLRLRYRHAAFLKDGLEATPQAALRLLRRGLWTVNTVFPSVRAEQQRILEAVLDCGEFILVVESSVRFVVISAPEVDLLEFLYVLERGILPLQRITHCCFELLVVQRRFVFFQGSDMLSLAHLQLSQLFKQSKRTG